MWHWRIILTCCKPSLWHTLSRHSLPLLSADNVHSIDVPSRSSTHITNNDLDTTLYWRLFFKRSLKGIFYDGHLSKILKCPKYDLLFNRMTYKRKHFGQGEKACIWGFIVHWMRNSKSTTSLPGLSQDQCCSTFHSFDGFL